MPELADGLITPDDLKSLALTNYGHYTSMRADDRRVCGLSLHMDRLVRDCRSVFNADLNRENVRELIRNVIRNKEGSFSIRVTVFDPNLQIGEPGKSAHPRVLVTTRPVPSLPGSAIRVQTLTYRRELPLVKHIGLFGSLWYRRAAQLRDFDDALFIDERSFVGEGTTWNIGFFDGDRVVWPAAEVLPGVTMTLLQQIHEQTITAPINVSEIADMKAAFAANATVGVRPIKAINDSIFPEDHPIFETLGKEYSEISTETL
ncbi:MAG: aminotransferase class IV family protein [Pseudonocardia sp.]